MAKSAVVDPDHLLRGLRKALAGPCSVQGDDADSLFPKGAAGKPLVQAAIDRGLIEVKKVTVPGRGRKKQIDQAVLTETGRQFILQADNPRAILEAIAPALEQIAGQSKTPAVHPSHEAIQQAIAACTDTLEKGFAQLRKTIDTAVDKLQATLGQLSAGQTQNLDVPAILSSLQSTLSRLNDGSVKVATPLPNSATAQRVETVVAEPTTRPIAPTGRTVRQAIREAYDELCLFKEYQDRIVEIPHLFHESATRYPGLTVEQFHQELEALNRERLIELHELNEVQRARERHLGMEKNDRLYYFIVWRDRP